MLGARLAIVSVVEFPVNKVPPGNMVMIQSFTVSPVILIVPVPLIHEGWEVAVAIGTTGIVHCAETKLYAKTTKNRITFCKKYRIPNVKQLIWKSLTNFWDVKLQYSTLKSSWSADN